jgi:hypothetical protein
MKDKKKTHHNRKKRNEKKIKYIKEWNIFEKKKLESEKKINKFF